MPFFLRILKNNKDNQSFIQSPRCCRILVITHRVSGDERYRPITLSGGSIGVCGAFCTLLSLRSLSLGRVMGVLLSLGAVLVVEETLLRSVRVTGSGACWLGSGVASQDSATSVLVDSRQSGVEIKGKACSGIVGQGSDQQIVVLERERGVLDRIERKENIDVVELRGQAPKGDQALHISSLKMNRMWRRSHI